jgi:hypothetical protein
MTCGCPSSAVPGPRRRPPALMNAVRSWPSRSRSRFPILRRLSPDRSDSSSCDSPAAARKARSKDPNRAVWAVTSLPARGTGGPPPWRRSR